MCAWAVKTASLYTATLLRAGTACRSVPRWIFGTNGVCKDRMTGKESFPKIPGLGTLPQTVHCCPTLILLSTMTPGGTSKCVTHSGADVSGRHALLARAIDVDFAGSRISSRSVVSNCPLLISSTPNRAELVLRL